MSIEIDHLRSWIGREEVAEDVITSVPVAALAATLDRDDAKPQSGDELPPLCPWLYSLPTVRQPELAPDGHAKRGGGLSWARRAWTTDRHVARGPAAPPLQRAGKIFTLPRHKSAVRQCPVRGMRHARTGRQGKPVGAKC